MKRCLTVLAVCGLAVGVVACAGGTDPATNVTNLSARLNAHGHTTGEPATWWWEYAKTQSDLGTANDTEVCGAGTGPKEPDNRCGPASWENRGDINLNVVVDGLTPNTTYYFRACGQDESWSQGACGSVKSFTTLAGTSYAFDRKWGTSGSGNGQFDFPTGIALDSSANVYVADEFNDRIQKFNSSGGFLTKWGSYGSGDGQFDGPSGVSVDVSGDVYVTDSGNFRVQKFNSGGGFLTKWDSGSASFLGYPWDVVASQEFSGGTFFTRVYVVDYAGGGTLPVVYRVRKYSSTGSFIDGWGAPGSGDGQFDDPRGLGADPRGGNIYVADSGNNRIQFFSRRGVFFGKWGSSGSGDGQFNFPTGIALDRAGAIYVADPQNHRIQKFDGGGTFITKWGSNGTADGQLNLPERVAVDKYGYVYVADTANNRIQKFKPTQ